MGFISLIPYFSLKFLEFLKFKNFKSISKNFLLNLSKFDDLNVPDQIGNHFTGENLHTHNF